MGIIFPGFRACFVIVIVLYGMHWVWSLKIINFNGGRFVSLPVTGGHDMPRLKCTRIIWIGFVCFMFILNTLFVIDLTFHHTNTKKLNFWHDITSSGPHEGPTKFISIKVVSSREAVRFAIDGSNVYTAEKKRGLHMVVLNQLTGEMMASRKYDTYIPGGDDGLSSFIGSVTDGRIICFAILDEASFSMKDSTRETIEQLGSKLIRSVKWRYMWAFVTIKGKGSIGEDVGQSMSVGSWSTPVTVYVNVPLESENSVACDWPDTDVNKRRRWFCSKYEGYPEVCNCANPIPITNGVPLSNNEVADIPVTIIASNRPQYLYKMIKILLSTPGSNSSLTSVYIDGYYQEPADVAALFGVSSYHHEPLSQKNGRIAQHYKYSLTKSFSKHPKTEFIVILEEDLEVAPDFFMYFSQTKHLLQEDPSLYCISAWNDQGYDHSCQDPAMLYRIETMPGLGWLLSRKLFKEELEPQWPAPDKLWDWDMWMRTDFIRKGRECVIPDISRTYHFGATGLNMNPYFQTVYFKKHTLNHISNVVLRNVDRLKKDNYEEDVEKLMSSAIVLDHSKDPCASNFGFIPKTKDKVYLMFISMEKHNDYGTWMEIAKCYHLWDLDARGFHKGLWRFWINENHLMVIGVPFSPYRKYKPDNVTPIKLQKPKKT